MAAELLAVGMVTPVGLTSASTAAAVRAGIARLNESRVWGRGGEPLVMGLLKDEHLPPLAPALEKHAGLSPHEQRLVRLAGSALREALARCPSPAAVPVLLGLHEPWPELPVPDGEGFLRALATQAGVEPALARSQVFCQGRASGLIALEQAMKLLAEERRSPLVVVGGVDSYLALDLLARLDGEGRLPTGHITDGFIPGEGAAFLLLGRPGEALRLGLAPLAVLAGVGLGQEPGHRYSPEPYLGEGLAAAFAQLFKGRAASPPISCVYSSLNGESFWAKEWGVAFMRNAKRFTEPFMLEHPVQNFGDPGAALGPLMVGLAALGLHRRHQEGPCLVWCSSDGEERGAALLHPIPA